MDELTFDQNTPNTDTTQNIEGYDADFEYPFPDELLPALILEVLQKELNMTLTTPVDMLNDGSGIVATKPVKESKGKSKK